MEAQRRPSMRRSSLAGGRSTSLSALTPQAKTTPRRRTSLYETFAPEHQPDEFKERVRLLYLATLALALFLYRAALALALAPLLYLWHVEIYSFIYGMSKSTPSSMACRNLLLYLWHVELYSFIYGMSKSTPSSMACRNLPPRFLLMR